MSMLLLSLAALVGATTNNTLEKPKLSRNKMDVYQFKGGYALIDDIQDHAMAIISCDNGLKTICETDDKSSLVGICERENRVMVQYDAMTQTQPCNSDNLMFYL
jgi:hypothetical protein